jgi:hypothetical protein
VQLTQQDADYRDHNEAAGHCIQLVVTQFVSCRGHDISLHSSANGRIPFAGAATLASTLSSPL